MYKFFHYAGASGHNSFSERGGLILFSNDTVQAFKKLYLN